MKYFKSYLIIVISLLVSQQVLRSQQPASSQNKAIAEIFTDFHTSIGEKTETTGFGLNRAYFGYSYFADDHFSANIIVNLGSPDDVLPGTVRRRYAYFREASVTWADEKLRVNFGLTDTRLFRYQQRFWGKRYLANTYQSLNGYGYVADLGVAADYKFSDIVSADLTIMNGEGYLELQLDDGVRSSLGINITPDENLAFRVYGDFETRNNVNLFTAIAFAGYRNNRMNGGIEFSTKSNLDGIKGHHGWGISGTGGVNFTKKNEFFVRYDYSTSVVPDGETEHWNSLRDGTFAIVGVQHTFTPNIKLALDYQNRNPYSDTRTSSNLIYLNALFKF